MTAVTCAPACLAVLDSLVDLERSRRFHAGRQPIDPAVAAELLARLDDRPRPLAVHVAGSEGKTSTTTAIAAGLAAAGRPAGAYTSPHLRDVRERLAIDGAFPSDAELDAAVATVTAAAARLRPSYFEFLTAMARVLFVPPRVPAAVWETGLGGRLDATRHLPADLCVITSISLEHTAVLGDTLAAIAAEKAGILRPGVPVVVAASLPAAARDVIASRAASLACPLHEADDRGAALDERSRVLAQAALGVLHLAGKLPSFGAAATDAVARHRVAGRLDERDGVLFDGAHTVAACSQLAEHLARTGRRIAALVFGVTAGRDGAAMLAALRPLAERIVLTRPPGDRGVDPETLRAVAPEADVQPDPEAALALARRRAPPGGRVLVTGSLHLVGRLLPSADTAA